MSDDSHKLEERLMIGLRGTPELKHQEKLQYLGEFRERVLKVLTQSQLADTMIYPEIESSLQDPRATHLLLNGELSFDFREKYIRLAHKFKVPYTMVHDTEQDSEVGLAVIAHGAVAEANISVQEFHD